MSGFFSESAPPQAFVCFHENKRRKKLAKHIHKYEHATELGILYCTYKTYFVEGIWMERHRVGRLVRRTSYSKK